MTEQPQPPEGPQSPQSPAPPGQPPVTQPVSATPPPPMARQGGPNGISIAALICGILSLPFALIPIFGVFISGPLAVLAIIFGFIGRNQATQRAGAPTGLATAGIVTGTISLLITILFIVGCGLAASQLDLDRVDRQLEQLNVEQPGDRDR